MKEKKSKRNALFWACVEHREQKNIYRYREKDSSKSSSSRTMNWKSKKNQRRSPPRGFVHCTYIENMWFSSSSFLVGLQKWRQYPTVRL